MKILYLSISFNINGNGLYNNLVDSLIDRGHEITIVRSDSSIEESYITKINKNYKLLNIKTGNPFVSNTVKKGLNLVRMAKYFKKGIKYFLYDEHFDLVLYATPPITLSNVIRFCKKKYNAKTFLMLKDIFPQNAVDLNMIKKDSLIYRYFRKQEINYYKMSDYIGCMSKKNIDYIIEHNPFLDKNKIHYFPNSIKVTESGETIFNKDKTVFMFGGNIGKPQNIHNLLNIIKELQNYEKAKFIIIGKGTEKIFVEKYIMENDLKNLEYMEFLPNEQYEKELMHADVGLISLDARFTIPNIPSKLQSYLRQKKPVLAITDTNTDLRNIIEENDCGWWCNANKYDEIKKTIKQICENKEEQIKKGKNGFNFFVSEYDVETNVDKIEDFFYK